MAGKIGYTFITRSYWNLNLSWTRVNPRRDYFYSVAVSKSQVHFKKLVRVLNWRIDSRDSGI